MYASKEKISTHCAICMKRYVNEYFFSQFFSSDQLVRCIRIFGRSCWDFFLIQVRIFWAVLVLSWWNEANWIFSHYLDFISIYYMHFWPFFSFSKLTLHLSWAIISNYLFCISKDRTFFEKEIYAWCHM